MNKIKLKTNPQKPFVLIIGGAKVFDKIEAVKSLIDKVDYVLVGGVLAISFLKAKGIDVGSSFLGEKFVDQAKETPFKKPTNLREERVMRIKNRVVFCSIIFCRLKIKC